MNHQELNGAPYYSNGQHRWI